MKRTKRTRRILIYEKDGDEIVEDCTNSVFSNKDIERILHEDDINEQIGAKFRKIAKKLDILEVSDIDLGKFIKTIKVKRSRIKNVQFENLPQ